MSIHNVNSYQAAITITPSDTAIINYKALFINGAGSLVLEPAQGGNTITITAGAGQDLPIAV